MAEESGYENFPRPSNSAVLRPEHLEFQESQESRQQSERNASRGVGRSLASSEVRVWEPGEINRVLA